MITKSTFPSKNCEDRAPKGWTLEELKEFAKSLNLPVSGKKADLCARIREFLANNSSDLSNKEEKEIVKEIKKIEKELKKEIPDEVMKLCAENELDATKLLEVAQKFNIKSTNPTEICQKYMEIR